jgi:outer membrane receptor for Fe3+-dicitrate
LITKIHNCVELFAVDRWPLNEKLTLVHGLRSVNTERDVRNLDVRSNTVRKPVADHDSINPDASVIYQLNDQINLFGKFVRLYEAPTNYELEDDLRGNNATLDATHGNVVEIGSRRQQRLTDSHSWNWDISLYYAALEDEILSQDDPMAPGTSLSINVDDTIHAGLEALVGNTLALRRTTPSAARHTRNFVVDMRIGTHGSSCAHQGAKWFWTICPPAITSAGYTRCLRFAATSAGTAIRSALATACKLPSRGMPICAPVRDVAA